MMKELQCNVENCKEVGTLFMGLTITIKNKTIPAGEKTFMRSPMCRTHALLFSIANEYADYSFEVGEMNASE